MKKVVIIIIIILLLTVGVAIFHFGLLPGVDYDTSGEYCESDADCSCRVFTGVEFVVGKDRSSCEQDTSLCRECWYE